MRIQIHTKNEPLEIDCDVLIVKETTTVPVPVTCLSRLHERPLEVMLVKESENLMLKAAILISQAIAANTANAAPDTVYVLCPDKTVLDAVCSVEYRSSVGGLVRCMAPGTKTSSPSRSRSRSGGTKKPQAAPAPVSDDAAPVVSSQDAASDPMEDPDLVSPSGEIILSAEDAPPAPDPRDVVNGKVADVMSLIKGQNIPSGQIPGCLEAIREANANGTDLAEKVADKLANDGSDGDPKKTAAKLGPVFADVRRLMAEIDAANKT